MSLFRDLKYFYRSLCSALKWFRFGWADRNWDPYYLLRTLKFKLDLYEEGLRKDQDYVGKEKNLKQIHICSLLCSRLMLENYSDYLWGKYVDKYYGGHLSWGNLNDTFPEKQEKEMHRELRFMSEYETRMCEQDKDLLFKIMKKHMGRWWV